MAKIYQGGLLNISAVDGNNCGSGLTPKPFQDAGMRIGRADYVERPVRRGTMNSATGAELVFLGHPPSAFSGLDSDKRKLSTRGWAFQEQLVSPATIHYTNWDMVWECCSDIKSERTWSHDPMRGMELSLSGVPLPLPGWRAKIKRDFGTTQHGVSLLGKGRVQRD